MPIAPLSNYQNAVIDRYKSNDGTPDYEKSWSYLDKIVNREIVKAGGLLVFNAVLIAVAVAFGPWWSVICPVLASLVLLLLLGVSRETASDMSNSRTDFLATARTVWQGMSLVDASVIVSAIGILILGAQRWV
jgi:hypothetical protein